jgi:hypothetical protein
MMKQLIEIQQELKAPKSQFNNFGKYPYRSCEDILEAVKPHLTQHKAYLTLSDTVSEVAGIPVITSKATITCGEESVSVTAQAGVDINRKGMDISQSFGASASYSRKYALGALLLLDDTKDADATNTHDKGDKKPTAPPTVDIEAKLRACTNEPELKKVFTSLTKAQKEQYTSLKDELKKDMLPF